jgi:hypothetical protein
MDQVVGNKVDPNELFSSVVFVSLEVLVPLNLETGCWL